MISDESYIQFIPINPLAVLQYSRGICFFFYSAKASARLFTRPDFDYTIINEIGCFLARICI